MWVRLIERLGRLFGATGLLLLVLMPLRAEAQVIVSLDVDPTVPVTVGESVFVDIFVDGVESSAPINAFSFTLSFDPLVLDATGVIGGDIFPAPSTIGPSFDVVDEVTYAEFALFTSASGSGRLATVELTAIAPGTSALTLPVVDLSGFDFLSGQYDVPVDEIRNGEAIVTEGTAPAPATPLLFAMGLLGFSAARRRHA